MKNGHGNDFMNALQQRGAVPLMTNQELAQQAINAQVERVFAESQQFTLLYKHLFKYAGQHDIVFAYTDGRWRTQYKSTRINGPTFEDIGGLFDWLITHAHD